MSTRHRPPVEHEPDALTPSQEGEGADLSQLRQRARDLIAAGDVAIERALSSDSGQFLQHSRQHGGQ